MPYDRAVTDDTPRLILGRFRPVDLARLLLVVLPCVPGLIFLAVGLVRDPLWPGQRPTSALSPDRARASVQAHELYLAGAITLFGGTLGTAAVIWKIARTRPEDADPSQTGDET